MLHPDLVPIFASISADAPDPPPLNATTLPAIRAAMVEQGRDLPAPAMATSEHRAGAVPLRLYRPDGAVPGALLLFLHGGGWMLGDLDTHDAMCRLLAAAAGCELLAVGYRLAPEHPFPAALDDARAAFDWVQAEAAVRGWDPARIAIGGESAGANLAAALALVLRDAGGAAPAFQLLVHPATDLAWAQPSIDTVALPGFGRAFLDTCAAFYAGDHDVRDPLISPLHAPDLTRLPPALVFSVEVDPLRDDAEHYALALARAGNEVLLRRLPGLPHGFMFLPATLAPIADGFRLLGAAVARYLSPP